MEIIDNLEKVCKKKYDFYMGVKTKTTRGAHNSGNDHSFVGGVDAKKTMPKDEFWKCHCQNEQ